MGTRGLQTALDRGEPLADFTICFYDEVDCVAMTDYLNGLADDFDLLSKPWYGDSQMRAGTATRGALLRLFKWRLIRVAVPGSTIEYMWAALSQPTFFSPMSNDVIKSVGLNQPGANDSGQWFDYGRDG